MPAEDSQWSHSDPDTDQSRTRSSNYPHAVHRGIFWARRWRLHPGMIIDGKEEAEASQYGVMNWTWKSGIGCCTSTVHDKLAVSDSRYFPRNRYVLTKKNAAEPALSVYNHRGQRGTGTQTHVTETVTLNQRQNGVISSQGLKSRAPNQWCHRAQMTPLRNNSDNAACQRKTGFSAGVQSPFKAAIINILS